MMSEKRYTFECIENNCLIYEDGTWLKIEEIVDCLNEQQATIQSLKEENEELKRKLEYCEHEHFLDSLGSSNKWFGMGGF